LYELCLSAGAFSGGARGAAFNQAPIAQAQSLHQHFTVAIVFGHASQRNNILFNWKPPARMAFAPHRSFNVTAVTDVLLWTLK
jgi:hypothetical protein